MKRALLCLFLLISASVFSQANLVVVNTDNSATYTAGQIRTYTVTVTNNGPEIATNVVVSDVLPVGIDMTTVSWSGSNGTTGTGGLNDTIATLANQGVVTYTVNIPVPSDYDQEENLVYEIVLTSTSVDPVPECEFCIDTDTPAPLADLVITKTNGQTQYLLGENTTYTITITNNGPSDVVNAVVNDPLPLGIATMTWSSSMGTSGTGAISDAIGAITNGQVITYTVVVSVPVGFLGNLTNVVSVVSATPDPVPACPQCSDTDTPRPKFISTSTTQYTVPELVTDVLVDSECALISNITWSSGTGNTSGIGYFHRQNSDFPLKSGVLLSTARATTAPGPATNTSITGATGSDAELLSYMQSLGLDPTLDTYRNVTKIEFDFTPLTDNMSFNFLFASDEYGTFQCTWSDAFAFFLTNTVTNTTTNLALVPNTTTPVSVITIRDNVNNTTCNSVNPEYFGQFNGGSNTSAINFEGQTVVMNASSEVVPYTVYHIKLVIGNRNDTSFNSAVFLEAGSFNIGQANIGDDLTIVTGQAICFGDTTVLDSALDPTIYEFEWRNNDVIIPGETGPILVVSEAGEYSLIASNIGTDCEMRDSIIIEFNPPLPVEDPNDLIQCQPLFNLRENQAIILANVPVAEQANYEFYYYASQADFDNSILIGNPDAYLSAGNQTIIIKVEDLASSTQCDAIFSFDLIVESCTPPQPADMSICDELPNDGQAVFDLTINDALVLDGEPASENTVTYHLTQDDANNGTPFVSPANAYLGSNNQTIYVRVQNNDDPLAVGFTNFNLIVIPAPEVVEMADVVVCDEYILPAVTVGNYFTGANGSGTQLQPGASITSSQTIYVYAQSGTVPNCTDEDSFTVEINITPVVDEPLDVVRCNEYVLPELTVGNYFTAPDGSGTPLFAGDAITTTQLVYIYAETGTVPNCSDQSSFTISIFESPEAVTPLPLEVCDDNNDGIAAFLLSSKTGEITAGNAGLVVTYHETLTNAQNNVLPLGASYTNINAWTQTVYARVTNAGAADCATIVELVLVVNPRPVPNAISDYELCDTVTPGDLIEEFLLSTKTAEATGGQAGISISYHATLADAQTGGPSIDANVPYANTPAGTQQIFVRIQNDATGCSATTSFNLIVNPLPSPVAPTPLAACSDGVNNTQAVFNLTTKNNEILGGQSGFSITYYESAADAGSGTNPINPANAYLGQDGQVIHVRMENEDTGCSSTTELTLQVIVGPVANDPQPLIYCDPNNDGFGTFDLSLAIPQIVGGAANVTVTFHETPQDAQFGTSAVSPTYSNINAWTQVIYVRVESNLAPCYDTVELQLIVNPTPELQTPSPIEVCDDNADGIGTFNLTIRESEILGNLDPTLHTISYHLTEADAIADNSPIGNVLAFNNTVVNTQTVWVRVEIAATGCYDTVPLVLIVNPLPVVPFPAAPYELCDINNTGDEIEEFDLAGYAGTITSVPGMAVSYYLTEAEALAGDPLTALPALYSNAVAGVQTIFVRVENQDTGCFAITLLDLRVEPLPAPVIPDITLQCDADGDGFGSFDLDELVEDILNGAPNTEITFHETYDNAQDGVFPLVSPYLNVNAFAQTLYIRAEDTVTGCFSVVAMQLEVKASPEMPELEPIQVCDTNQDGIHTVDLTQQTQPILDAQTGAGPYTVRYYASLAAAEAGTGAIVTPQNYTGTDGQTIWVRVTDTVTGCFTVGSFELEINTPLALAPAYQLSVCDNTESFQDNIAVFDLTSMDAVITGNTAGHSVQYFLTLADVQSGNAIATPGSFSNGDIPGTNNPYTLFVTVTDAATGCVSTTTLTIRVLPLPTPNTDPAPLVACDNVDSPNGTEIFDLTVNETYLSDGDPNLIFEYYDADGNQIPDPTAYEGVGIIYIHVMNSQLGSDGENCHVIVEQLLIVNPLPVVNPGVVNAVCQQSNNGFAVFTLSDSNADVLGAGQDIADFTFSYHLTLAEAQAGTGALADQYTNTTINQQEVFVRVVNTTTGCVNTVGVMLIADNGSTAGEILDTDPRITTCDDDGINDGFYEFDLTQFDAEILGTQGPEYTLHYYDDQALMNLDIAEGPTTTYSNAIVDPATYTNLTAFSQTIYALVINTTSVTGCPAIEEFILTVNPLPEPVITDDNNGFICVDFVSGTASPVVLTTNYSTDPGYSFEWYLGADLVGTDPTYTITSIAGATATYGLIVTNLATGCVSEREEIVITRSGAAVITDIQVTNAFTDSQTITVITAGYGQYEYSLDGGAWQSSNVFYDVPLGVTQGGEHSIEVRDVLGGCDNTGPEEVFLIGYPKYFTPNGDGIHDTWNIVGLYDQPNAKIYIFDRYGKLIKQLSPSADSQGWDGTMNGSPLPSTDYWFRVEYVEQGVAKEFRAHFSLKR